MVSKSQQRSTFLHYYTRGYRNASEIARLISMNRRTASRYMKRLNSGESLEDRPRSGRPKRLNRLLIAELRRIAKEHPSANLACYTRELHRRKGVTVSRETARKAIRGHLFKHVIPQRRNLTSSHKAERLAFAREHHIDSWDNKISCDEAYFNLNRKKNKRWVEVGHEEDAALPKLTNRQEKISVGVVAAVLWGRKLALGFLPKNWNGANLGEVFDSTILPSLGGTIRSRQQYEWMMDNDGRHREASWLHYVERKRLRVISPWPSNSPDLQPIENLFSEMKRMVEHYAPTTEEELRAAIGRAWRELQIEHVNNCFRSMPERLNEVRRLRGARTRY